jgi:D-alanyl-lipoteichoic acid acyltransferase DltB (MBOAT superfamily)
MRPLTYFFIGLSYVSFRISYLAMEIRNKRVTMPILPEYLAFVFYAPIMSIGPITSFKSFQESFERKELLNTKNYFNSFLRILIGAVKFYFIANILSQTSFSAFIEDGHKHIPLDFVLASISYYLFLYFNFSGFCDIVIGASGLMGISIDENFNNPLRSRNVQDFWGRWHITLGRYMKEMLFNPLSTFLLKTLGSKFTNTSIATALAMIFILVGIWHGKGIQFVLFGVLQAIGVVSAFLYGQFLKKKLGAKNYKKYLSNKIIYSISVILNFLYISLSLSVFANTPEKLVQILNQLVF